MSATPGPWRALPKVGTRERTWHVVNESGGLIAEIDGAERARFIAAAPELRHALDIARHAIELLAPLTTPRQQIDVTLAIIDAAIAKAEVRS